MCTYPGFSRSQQLLVTSRNLDLALSKSIRPSIPPSPRGPTLTLEVGGRKRKVQQKQEIRTEDYQSTPFSAKSKEVEWVLTGEKKSYRWLLKQFANLNNQHRSEFLYFFFFSVVSDRCVEE